MVWSWLMLVSGAGNRPSVPAWSVHRIQDFPHLIFEVRSAAQAGNLKWKNSIVDLTCPSEWDWQSFLSLCTREFQNVFHSAELNNPYHPAGPRRYARHAITYNFSKTTFKTMDSHLPMHRNMIDEFFSREGIICSKRKNAASAPKCNIAASLRMSVVSSFIRYIRTP